MTTRQRIVFHPILFSMYPVFSLWAGNIQEISFSQVVRSLIVILLLTLLFWMIASRVWGDRAKSALLISMGLILFFSYGHLYDVIRTWSFDLARHRYLVPALGITFLAWVWFLKRLRQPEPFGNFFNAFGSILVLMALYGIGKFGISAASSQSQMETPVVIPTVSGDDLPDIYYIIVDGYGRQDVLADYYDFDNSMFLDYLEEKGFYVATNSTSNYRKTVLSLTSSLNMVYLQDLFPGLDPDSKDYNPLYISLKHNAVRLALADQGYQLITVDNGMKTTIEDAEILFVLDPDSSEDLDPNQEKYSLDLNGFEGLLIQTSAARLWVDWQVKQGGENPLTLIEVEAPYNRHRETILFGIETLMEVPEVSGNNFVFVHLVSPHPPFVFGPNGERVKHDRLFTILDGPFSQGSKEDYVQGYIDQVTYLNGRLMGVVDYILEHSAEDPIIIIQGDHGPKAFTDDGMETADHTENFGILNAYYFPDQRYARLYPSISPVNSFRIVLNEFFGMDFPLLEDENYYSDAAHPFEFMQVTDQIR